MMPDAQRRTINPANFFLFASLIVGLVYCVVIPYGAGFDEERHLVRIYYMSQGHMMPNFPKQSIHQLYAELSYQRRISQSPAFDLFKPENFLRRFGAEGEKLRYGQKTQSIYSPFIFLPQALIGRVLWWHFDFPFLPTVIVQRMAGLLIYIAGAYFAIRVVPFGKWIFAALALLPSALYQAATLNADGFTNAVSFAFIGFVLAVYAHERDGIQTRSVWVLAGLSLLLGLAKPGAVVLLPLVLILFRHCFPSKWLVLILVIGLVFSVAVNVGWWMLASRNSTFADSGAQSVPRQLNQLIADPGVFLGPLVQSIILTFPAQVRGVLASYGYWAGIVPEPVFLFSFFLLIAALLADSKGQISVRGRVFLAGCFVLCFVVIYGIAFIANYSDAGLLALEKHGRYYIPFVPLIFLALGGVLTVRADIQRYSQFAVAVFFLITIGYYSFGIYTAYYTYCGYDAYAGDECMLPVFKNLEEDVAPEVLIRQGGLVTQTFVNQCGALKMVQVLVKSFPGAETARLRFSIFDQDRQMIASRDFSSVDHTTGEFLSLLVNPPLKKAQAVFLIQLEAIDLSPADAIIIASISPKAYSGQFSVNGDERPDNLLMHYVCIGP